MRLCNLKIFFLYFVSKEKLNKHSCGCWRGEGEQQKEKRSDDDLGLISTVDISGHISGILRCKRYLPLSVDKRQDNSLGIFFFYK